MDKQTKRLREAYEKSMAFMNELERRYFRKVDTAGWVAPKSATSELLLDYIKQDIERMDLVQLRKTYKRVRKIVAGLE